MTPRKRLVGLGAFALASSLVLTACGGGGGGDDTGDGNSTGIVTVGNGEPQNPIIPTMTNETFGSKVTSNVFAGLVYYDAEGVVHNEVAESIESEDNKVWTITLKDGWTFSDGTPVTAQSFVDAWNYGAYAPNAQNLSYFFEPIEGFTDVQFAEDQLDKDGAPKEGEVPASETMSGLEAVSETELQVTLAQPESDFPLRLGYSAFYPLPESFHDDPEAFGEEPIGNGPYVLDTWEHNRLIELRPNDSYAGEREVQNGGVDLVAYTDEDSAYNDLLDGNLDIVTNVPASAFGTFEEELGDRAVNQPAAVIQVINVPEYVEGFQGEAGLLRRQAISMAIDRDQVTETVFSGSRTPATDFTSPVINGWSDDLEGNEVLDYNPEEAKRLWDEAEAIEPWGDEPLYIASNADSDHQSWIDPTCNGIRDTLGIDCEFDAYPTFDEFLDARDNEQIKGLFRGGWQADYPAMSNFLGPIYGTGAGSNDMGYSSEEFDAKLDEAAGESDPDAAIELYKEAQTILFQDLPGIPLWYNNATGGWSEAVDNVVFGWDSDPLLYQVTKSE
ncbi:peptide ABC transporter substrate-binding protein [Promicromonospora iranensis]|uniref:Oligopeptide transport system substrate-binding protein n=1 Tax=Promicromonospora iranensis TaxID=1105144 RepID=A0ABU2CSB2_9MICO|nr:ABC transporter substrate-binding protein [Promicromonospora iranensis]MDR7384228.1 oligopeptide transport system substrate-binding protein [Promicromonospora iranensis]